jgi:hypothetical protein
MKLVLMVLGISIFVFIISPASHLLWSEALAAFDFPKGAEWTYQGIVQWVEEGKTQQKSITSRMKILDRIERSNGIIVYVMKCHPLDLGVCPRIANKHQNL